MLKPNNIITGLAVILVLGVASCQKVPSREVSEKDKSKQEEVLPTTSYKAEDYVRNNFSYNVFDEDRTWSDKNEFLENASKLVGVGNYFLGIEMFKAGVSEWLYDIERERKSHIGPKYREGDTMWTCLVSLVDSNPERHHFVLWDVAIDNLYQNDKEKHDLEDKFRSMCSKIGCEEGNIRMSYDEYIKSLIDLEKRLGNYDITPDSLDISTPMNAFETFMRLMYNQNLKTLLLCFAGRPYVLKQSNSAEINEIKDLNTPVSRDKVSWKSTEEISSEESASIRYEVRGIKNGEEILLDEGRMVLKRCGNKWLINVRESED